MPTRVLGLPLLSTGASLQLSGPLSAESAVNLVAAYHERSKHHPQRYAASLGYMDWSTQPDPFRRYAGAELVQLPLPEDDASPAYVELYEPSAISPVALSLDSISQFFRYSLALTAWKRAGATAWPLRANPSSGNLHPTEGYVLLPALEGLSALPCLYHYAVKEHALERRALLNPVAYRRLSQTWPAGSFLVGISSIHWREAWKYGERAFRYCQHDVGHALAALRISAASLGWKLSCVERATSEAVGQLLGLDRDEDYMTAEREEPELLALVRSDVEASDVCGNSDWTAHCNDPVALTWFGRANSLSPEHAADWPVIEQVAEATRQTQPGLMASAEKFYDFPALEELATTLSEVSRRSAREVILGRRSATAMDGKTRLSRETFFHMLARLIPSRGGTKVPWDAIPWRPRIHLGLFVHRVTGLPRGLYALLRDPKKLLELRAVLGRDFLWQRVSDCPEELPLYLLEEGDFRQLATALSCGQAIAGDGAFSLAMLADYHRSLKQLGPAFYRRLFWEAGMIGQVLYLEAQAAGVGATGIGCYFDDQVHETLGLTSSDWQSLYHFTVGGPVEDQRLSTLPAYDAAQREHSPRNVR